MKDSEIYELFKQATGILDSVVSDYRPCNKFYADKLGIPTVKDTIIVRLKENGTLVYIPDKDNKGAIIDSRASMSTEIDKAAGMADNITKGSAPV